MINPLTNTHIFYHVTGAGRIVSILRRGLLISSKPFWYDAPVPYVYISVVPFSDYLERRTGRIRKPVLLELDMKGFDLGGGQEEIDKWNNSEFCHDDWQVKIFGNIPADRISSLTVGDMTDITLRYASDLCGQWDKKYPENLT